MADCQVDFYVLARPELDARKLACKLALMAWEHGHRTQVVADDMAAVRALDELLWSTPQGRFVPHGVAGTAEGEAAPIRIGTLDALRDGDLVINLGSTPLPEPERFNRLLEIVPNASGQREASRRKFATYRQHGLEPQTHDIAK